MIELTKLRREVGPADVAGVVITLDDGGTGSCEHCPGGPERGDQHRHRERGPGGADPERHEIRCAQSDQVGDSAAG